MCVSLNSISHIILECFFFFSVLAGKSCKEKLCLYFSIRASKKMSLSIKDWSTCAFFFISEKKKESFLLKWRQIWETCVMPKIPSFFHFSNSFFYSFLFNNSKIKPLLKDGRMLEFIGCLLAKKCHICPVYLNQNHLAWIVFLCQGAPR